MTSIIGSTLFGAMQCFQARPIENTFSDNSMVIIIIAFGSLLISLSFLGIYSIGIDALFLCYCEDLIRNKGTADSPYFMSSRMRSLVHIDTEIVILK